jgi:hypothetical protein
MRIQVIANQVKMALDGFDEEKMYHQMVSHYRILRLIDDKGQWQLPALQALSSDLLPKDFGERSSKAFVDEIVHLAAMNPYFMNFMSAVENETFESVSDKTRIKGMSIFQDIVAFAIVLERLTIAMYNDLKLVLDLIEYFKELRGKPGVFKRGNVFHKIKLQSIERPLQRRSLDGCQTGFLSPTAFRLTLPVNISEACLLDYFKGHRSNAKAGWPLIINRPGAAFDDPKTGAGPTRWSPNKNAISLHMPLAKEWADLYQTWNMAFVVQFPFYPYLITKLFIPQVARYQDTPNEYIHNRVLALYLALNYSGFRFAIDRKDGKPEFDWRDKRLTHLWGKSNLESAQLYKRALQKKEAG